MKKEIPVNLLIPLVVKIGNLYFSTKFVIVKNFSIQWAAEKKVYQRVHTYHFPVRMVKCAFVIKFRRSSILASCLKTAFRIGNNVRAWHKQNQCDTRVLANTESPKRDSSVVVKAYVSRLMATKRRHVNLTSKRMTGNRLGDMLMHQAFPFLVAPYSKTS